MANHSTFLSTAILNAAYRAQAFPAISTVYMGLFTAAPTDAGGGTEISTSGTGYARTAVTFAAPSGTPPQIQNSADITFPVASSAWGTLTHFALFDALTSGNLLDWAPIVDPADFVTPISVIIGVGDRYIMAAGNLTVSED